MTSLLYFVGSFALAFILTYWVRSWAGKVGLLDIPDNGRHLHERPTPVGGGIALYLAMLVVLTTGFVLGVPSFVRDVAQSRMFGTLFFGTTAIFLIGILDDLKNLTPRTKFGLEVVVATMVFVAGIRITGAGFGLDIPVWASYPITVLWIVGLTNAFNLIDGSDGIAAGAALFAAICMAVVFALNGSQIGSAISIALAGATLGFLFFNFPPASIFLGDSGSLLLGFTLALLGILTTQEASMTLAVAIPVLSLGFPLLDTGLTIGRRFLRRQPIFASDRAHIHHRLRDLGHTPRGVAFVLYGACAVFSLIALLMLSPAKAYAPVVFVALGTALWLAVQRLRLPELLEVQRVARRVMRQRDVIAHNIRLREALSSIRRAQSPKEILDALCLACIGGDFERMELSMVTPDGEVLSGQHGVVSTKNGCQWIWEKPNAVPLNQRSELRTPILTADGRTVGRLSVWCSFANHFFLTDIHLLAVEFQPEIHAALGRVQNLAAVRAAEAASTRPAEPQAQVLPSLEKLA